MSYQIRKAILTDLSTLLEFEAGIVEAERPFDNSLKEGEIHYYDLTELIKSDLAEVLLLMDGKEVVGSGYAKIIKAKDYQIFEEYAYLGFMYVKPEHRGQGVNKIIIEALVSWSKSMGMTEVRLEVYDENEIAKKAYFKSGFKPNLLEMKLSI